MARRRHINSWGRMILSKVDTDLLFLLGTGLWVRCWWKCIVGSIWDAFNKNGSISAVGARVDWVGRATRGRCHWSEMWFRIHDHAYEMEDHHVKAKKEVAKRRKLASGQQVCN